MKILGIDPGTRITGYGVILVNGGRFSRVAAGVIDTSRITAMDQKLNTIFTTLTAIMIEFRPDVCSVETAFYGKNVQSTLKLGHVRGVVLLGASLQGIAVAEYSPREVKRAVTGTGAAAKQQVEFMVRTLLNIGTAFKRSDEADGLALALCHGMNLMGVPVSGASGSWEDFIRMHPERIQQ